MFEHRKLRKRIEHAELLTAASADGTVVRAIGVVRVYERTLIAPASGRVAVICAIEAHDAFPSEPGGWMPRPAFRSVDTCPFVLQCDDAGPVVVTGDFVELVDVAAVDVTDLSPGWQPYCVERGLSATRAREAAVQPGHRICVVGVVERRPIAPGQEAGFREIERATYIVGDFDHPLLVTPAVSPGQFDRSLK